MAHHPFPAILLAILLLAGAGCMGGRGFGASQTPLAEVQQPGLGWIEGTVVDQDFKAVEGATLRITGTDRQALAGPDGKFRFLNLGTGTFTLEASATGWQSARMDAEVVSGRGTPVTFFLDPLLVAEPYHDLKFISGRMTCVLAEVGTTDTSSFTCTPTRKDLGFPSDWAATLTEVTWGPSGFASDTKAVVTLGLPDPSGGMQVYARVTTTAPARISLLPGTSYPALGGTLPTPAGGVQAPLQIEVRRAPTTLVSNVATVSATVDQTYSIYHTMFYLAAPSDLEGFSALPR